MSIEVSLPQVGALKSRVEEKLGFSLNTHNRFLQLVIDMEDELGEHMSESTLERIWNYSTRQRDTVSLRTLDVLSRFVGYPTWEDFCDALKREAQIESEFFTCGLLNVDDLSVGDRLRIGWQPDRICIVRYLGDHRFVAEETLHASMHPGDCFSCLQFQKDQPLYLDHFQRVGEDFPETNLRYAVGQEHGLSVVEKLAPKK